MPAADDCPFGPRPHRRGPPHDHPYEPGPDAVRQCTCGSRTWKVTIAPGLPASVICARCARPNRLATAYERGRAAGPRRRDAATSSPPF